MRLALVACLFVGFLVTPAREASVALVLAGDVSESVSADRYALQHEGIARAFEAPQLIEAIAAAPGGIEALVMEWSDPDKKVGPGGGGRSCAENREAPAPRSRP